MTAMSVGQQLSVKVDIFSNKTNPFKISGLSKVRITNQDIITSTFSELFLAGSCRSNIDRFVTFLIVNISPCYKKQVPNLPIWPCPNLAT